MRVRYLGMDAQWDGWIDRVNTPQFSPSGTHAANARDPHWELIRHTIPTLVLHSWIVSVFEHDGDLFCAMNYLRDRTGMLASTKFVRLTNIHQHISPPSPSYPTYPTYPSSEPEWRFATYTSALLARFTSYGNIPLALPPIGRDGLYSVAQDGKYHFLVGRSVHVQAWDCVTGNWFVVEFDDTTTRQHLGMCQIVSTRDHGIVLITYD